AAVLPMGYFLWFWSNTAFSRVRAVVLMTAATMAIIPTQSKGAFISGSISFLVSVLFGRKLIVQVVVGLAALAVGGTIITMLPRMEQMKRIGSEEGVQGRMLAWAMARTVTLTHPTGMGYKQFHPLIRFEGLLEEKAPHSSVVMVGGDLGPVGLTIYIGMLLVCARSLIQYKGLSISMERCRRTLFSLLTGLCVSGWMLDRAYYTEVFCLIGAVGAYHLLSVKQRREAALAEQTEEAEKAAKGQEVSIAAYGLSTSRTMGAATMAASKAVEDEEKAGDGLPLTAEAVKVPGLWTRLGLLDMALAIMGGQLALQFWDYVLTTIKP
ncbi:MAG: hypothetical protein JWO94_1445, partial [Verrucomicrobiaceae bacterium]|nr:hypothetical protein [Verrucomicrobiaceae bacterium]